MNAKLKHDIYKMSLGFFPVELLTVLGSFCNYTQLASLARTNHAFHALFNPILYKLNAADVPRKSCLHWAVWHDSLSTLKLAIAYGADINNTGAENESCVLQLLDLDEDLFTNEDFDYGAPLHLAVLKERPEMVRWLLDNNARLDVPSYQVCCCSSYYGPKLWYPLHFAMCKYNDEILRLLLERGALYSAKDVIGFCCAVRSGEVYAVENFIQLDIFDPNYRDSSYMTPLHWVHQTQKQETAVAITERLLQRGVPVNVKDIEGRTALCYLVLRLMWEPAMVLLRHGADPTIDDDGDQGVDMLKWCFHEADEKEIQRAREVDPSKAEALSKRRLEFAKLVIKGGVDVNGRLNNGRSSFSRPLFWALAETRDVRCVQVLLDAGADINSAVDENCHTESESILRCFFDLFGEKQENDTWIWRPLQTDLRGYKESVCLLLERGARIDAVGDEYSALSKACELERKKGALTLLVENATCRNTELRHVAKLRERYKADELTYNLLDGFYHQLEAEMRMGVQETISPVT
jgi:ankyrin repeat protein